MDATMRRCDDHHFLDGTKATIARAGEFVWRDEMDLNTLFVLGDFSNSSFILKHFSLYIYICA